MADTPDSAVPARLADAGTAVPSDESDALSPSERCGAWGGCRLPRGHNEGKPDTPQAHGAFVGYDVPLKADLVWPPTSTRPNDMLAQRLTETFAACLDAERKAGEVFLSYAMLEATDRAVATAQARAASARDAHLAAIEEVRRG